MLIILNNREVQFETSGLSVDEIIKLNNFTYKRLVVRLNRIVIKSEEYHTTIVNNGDNLEVIHLMAGG